MARIIENEVLKRAVIAGASAALKYKRKKLSISEEEVLEEVIANVDSIVEGIDRE
ncbi:hypothetical protein J4411_01265 [Candidatus Pacearchaeota archaeon]|nr:hypothetical protein [uncultured archaeon]MBS3084523.1 hypothetical protein [Candidatus Pacearchaeota archaeon]